MRHTMKTFIVGEITATLEEAVNDVGGGGDGEVVVVDKGGQVDNGGEERAEDVFVRKIQRKLGLGVDLHKHDRGS